MAYRRSGLGMYPDETCFDPSRPSWLPYWLDDLSESTCKWNELVSGNPTGNTAQPGQAGADPTTIQNAYAACVAQGGSWNSALNVCAPSIATQYGPYLIAGVAGLFFLVLLMKK